MTSLEVSAEPSTNVHPRAEAESGVTAVDPRCPVLVARLWPPRESVFDSEINPLPKSAKACPRGFTTTPGPGGWWTVGPGELRRTATNETTNETGACSDVDGPAVMGVVQERRPAGGAPR